MTIEKPRCPLENLIWIKKKKKQENNNNNKKTEVQDYVHNYFLG